MAGSSPHLVPLSLLCDPSLLRHLPKPREHHTELSHHRYRPDVVLMLKALSQTIIERDCDGHIVDRIPKTAAAKSSGRFGQRAHI